MSEKEWHERMMENARAEHREKLKRLGQNIREQDISLRNFGITEKNFPQIEV